ncbi:MAG: GGDEF domain-containing protein [Frankiaceae bacterium]
MHRSQHIGANRTGTAQGRRLSNPRAAQLAHYIRPVVVGLAALYVAWAVTFAITPERHHVVDAWWCVGTAAGLIALAAVTLRRRLSAAAAERVALAVAVLVTANAGGYLIQTGDPKETTNVMLLVIASAVVFPSLWSFGSVVAMSLGAWSYAYVTVPSPEWSYFAYAMLTSLVVAAVIFATRRGAMRRLAEARAELRDMAVVDELTGLHNHRGFAVLAEQAMLDADRSGTAFALLLLRVDRPAVSGGLAESAAGEAALLETASLLRAAFRGADVVARLGAGDFCVLLPAASPGVSYADRLHSAVIEANSREGRAFALSLAITETGYDPARPAPIEDLIAARAT